MPIVRRPIPIIIGHKFVKSITLVSFMVVNLMKSLAYIVSISLQGLDGAIEVTEFLCKVLYAINCDTKITNRSSRSISRIMHIFKAFTNTEDFCTKVL